MKQKFAVITGSTRGIGRAIAEELLKKNYSVIINYSSDDQAYNEFLEKNNMYKDKIYCIKKSLDTYENAIEFCNLVKQITNEIYILILNCGIIDKCEFGKITKEIWEKSMNINLNCPFYIIQGLSENLKRNSNYGRGGGRIILLSSIMGRYPHSTSLVYNVSKAGVIALSKSLVKYFCEDKITVNSICPGFIETPYHHNRTKESYEKINNKIALHRFGTPKEVASVCMEIINNEYINGSILDINGGYDYF